MVNGETMFIKKYTHLIDNIQLKFIRYQIYYN